MSDRLLIPNGESVVHVHASGSDWSASSVPLPGAECVAVSPLDSSLVFVGSFTDGTYRSTDGGETFERLDFPHQTVTSIAISPADGAVYVGTEPSMLFRSRDRGETWVELEALRAIPSNPTWSFPPRPWTHHVRQIAPSPHDPQLILAGIELGGIMRSTDDGATWQDHRPHAVRDCHGLTWHPTEPGRVYEAAGGGSAWSHDSGDTWLRIDDGRDARYRHYLTAVAVDPLDADCWYVGAAPTPWQTAPGKNADAAIYRWKDDGPWEALGGGLPESLDGYPFKLVATDSTVYAGLKDGRLWAGHQRAESWRLLPVEGDPVKDVRDMAVLAA